MRQTQSGEEDEKDMTPIYKWWHNKLADYFEMSENYDRKVEVRKLDRILFLYVIHAINIYLSICSFIHYLFIY